MALSMVGMSCNVSLFFFPSNLVVFIAASFRSFHRTCRTPYLVLISVSTEFRFGRFDLGSTASGRSFSN